VYSSTQSVVVHRSAHVDFDLDLDLDLNLDPGLHLDVGLDFDLDLSTTTDYTLELSIYCYYHRQLRNILIALRAAQYQCKCLPGKTRPVHSSTQSVSRPSVSTCLH